MAKKKISSYERIRARAGYIFISLWLVGFILFFLLPFITSIVYSFCSVKVDIGEVKLAPVGFSNYIALFLENEKFLSAFTSTLTNVLTQTPLIIVFSLFIAIILNQKFHGRLLARAVFFLPVVIAGGVVMDIINGNQFMSLAMSGGRNGMMFEADSVYDILMNMGFNTIISEYIANMVNSIFRLAWNSGIQILLFLSGLQSINPALYEVAKVEGAGAWVSFWKITLPMIAPTILVNLIYTIIDNFINYSNDMFKLIQEVTGNIQFDKAAAMANICFIVIFLLIGIVYVLIDRHIYYTVD